jgi:outer membrane protein assembly factor BamB
MQRLFMLLTLFCLTAVSAYGDDWPAWRGPTGQGYCFEKNLPVKWSDKENVKWKIKLEHPGYSTPIVWKDKIFLTEATPAGDVRSLLCLDRANGKTLWKSDVKYAANEQRWRDFPYCHASPVTDGERVVVSFGSAGMYCYDFKGVLEWKRTDLGTWQHQFGNSSSPVLYGDLAILWCGPNEKKGRNYLLAVNKKTGKTVWEHDEKVGSWSTPLIAKVNGQDQMLLGMSFDLKGKPDPDVGALKGIDPKTGKVLWHCQGLDSHVYTSPLYSNGIAVAMSGYNGAAIAVKLGGAGDITKDRLWKHPKNTQRVGSGIIVGNHVYILEHDGMAKCYELTTGKEVWQVSERIGSTGNWGSMVHADGKLYVLAHDGRTYIYNANPKYELIAVNGLGKGQSTNSSPAISDGEIFLRTEQNLWCISAKK